MKAKVLVTGATGFIGSHLCERLARDGYAVTALVRKGSESGARDECLAVLKKLKVRICYGDLADAGTLKGAVKGCSVVFHLAAIARPMAIPREEYFRVNEEGTRNLLEACRKAKVGRIVHMSSISAVGPSRDGRPVDEKTASAPADVYGESKLAAEDVVHEFVKKHGMDIVMLRPPMVFGPRDTELLRLFRIINKGLFPVRVGKESRTEFLYVENLVEACMLAMKKGAKGEAYHIAGERSYNMNEIVGAIAKAEGVRLLPLKVPNFCMSIAGWMLEAAGKVFGFHPPFKHDTTQWMTGRFWYSDTGKARRELGYTAPVGLEEGVKRTVEYYRKEGLL